MSYAVAFVVLVLAAAWRLIALGLPALGNFAPLMALTFCAAVYFRDRRAWFVPLAALVFSDLYLDHYYAVTYGEVWRWPSALVRIVCFTLALPIGRIVARRRNWVTLLGGALAASVSFYLATNTDAWLRDPHYVKSVAGWWQALTIGRPEFPPTLLFFRNTLLSDLGFTAVFAAVMEYVVRDKAQPTGSDERVEA